MPRGIYKRNNGKRYLSPKAIRAISRAQKARWAKYKADKKAGKVSVINAKPVKPPTPTEQLTFIEREQLQKFLKELQDLYLQPQGPYWTCSPAMAQVILQMYATLHKGE